MYCPKCGSFVTDDAQFCSNCNEPITRETVSNSAQTNDGVYYTPQQSSNEQSAYSAPQQNNPYNNPNEQNTAYYNNGQPNYNSQPNYFNQAQSNNQGYYQACPPNQFEQQFKEAISSANTLGILAIVLGILLTPLAGIICGAVGLSKLNSIPNIPMSPVLTKDKDKARKLNIWGIALPIALYVVAVILMIIMVTVMGFATASAASFM